MMNKLLPLGLIALAIGCFDISRVPGGPPTGYETDYISCEDRRDNDNDGLIDCQDPDCIGRGHCSEIIEELPPEGEEFSVETCSDRIDNDLDGQFDCGDRQCQSIRELCCVTEFSDAACSNGVDDDGNGFADCEDFACRSNPYVTVCQRETDCEDDRDNDNDGETDCDDSDCAGLEICGATPPEMGDENTFERCTDGFDNDGNGFEDCRDFSCCDRDGQCVDPRLEAVCLSGETEDTTAACTDGMDNDGNGFLDCGEFGCCSQERDANGCVTLSCINQEVQSYCNSTAEDTMETCTDGIDNNGNGFLDCEDFSCSRSCDPAVRAICEANYASCIDGLDNDGDRFPDCSDFSCRDVVERVTFTNRDGEEVTFEASPCSESVVEPDTRGDLDADALRRLVATAVERCTDGIDGDNDGFIDCNDWDCQWNPLLNPLTRGDTAPGLCQGGFFDASLNGGAGAWRAVQDGDPDRERPNVPLLCR